MEATHNPTSPGLAVPDPRPRSELEAMNTGELRTYVRDVNRAHPLASWKLTGVQIAGMSKAACLAWYYEGIVPVIATKPQPEQQEIPIEVVDAIEPVDPNGSLDAAIAAIVRREVDKATRRTSRRLEITITNNDKGVTTTKRQHYLFPLVAKILGTGVNLAVTGPAGSGKTFVCMEAATALGLEYRSQSFTPMTTKSDLMGYMNATGGYVPSAFYLAFKNGWVFIADEFDGCNPAIAIVLNQAIANREACFPNNEQLKAHASFRIIFAMNTVGQGATLQYVGRNQLDAATLDRFALLHFPYDEALEREISGGTAKEATELDLEAGGKLTDPDSWITLVQKYRRAFERLKFSNIISPRASQMGVALGQAGIGMKYLKDMILHKALSLEQIARAEQAVAMPS